MNIKYTSKDIKFTGALKGFTEERLEILERIDGPIIDGEVIISKEKLNHSIEIILKTKLNSYSVKSKHPILKQALRKNLLNLKSQVKKNKSKLKNKKRRISKESIKNNITEKEKTSKSIKEVANHLTISQNFSPKPISVEEAVMRLKECGDNAYLFRNLDNENITVVFYNKDKHISMIEANPK